MSRRSSFGPYVYPGLLSAARHEAGLSLEVAAVGIGISSSSLRRLEDDRAVPRDDGPRLGTLARAGAYYGLSLDQLVQPGPPRRRKAAGR